MLTRIDSHDSADRFTGMLDSEWTKSARRENLECLAMKECRPWILRLFIEIVSQRLQTALQILLGIGRIQFQAYAEPLPTRRQRQTLHDRLGRRHHEQGPIRPYKTSQYRGPSAGDLFGRLQSIKWQSVQSREHEYVERRIKRMQHATQPLCTALIFGEEYDALAARLPPLFEEIKRQHAERRRGRDRRTR